MSEVETPTAASPTFPVETSHRLDTLHTSSTEQIIKDSENVVHTTLKLPTSTLSREFWMKDERTNNCSLCETEFTLFRRKHHCRICGKIICKYCLKEAPGFIFRLQGSIKVCRPCASILVNNYSRSQLFNHSLNESKNRDLTEQHPFVTLDELNSNDQVLSSFGDLSSTFEMPNNIRPPEVAPMIAIPSSRSNYDSPGWAHHSIFLDWSKRNLDSNVINVEDSESGKYNALTITNSYDAGPSSVSTDYRPVNFGKVPSYSKLRKNKAFSSAKVSDMYLSADERNRLEDFSKGDRGLSFVNLSPNIKATSYDRLSTVINEPFISRSSSLTDERGLADSGNSYHHFSDSDDESLFNDGLGLSFHANSVIIKQRQQNVASIQRYGNESYLSNFLKAFLPKTVCDYLFPSSTIPDGLPALIENFNARVDKVNHPGGTEEPLPYQGKSRASSVITSSKSTCILPPWILFSDSFNQLVCTFLGKLLFQMLNDEGVDSPMQWVLCLPKILLKMALDLGPDIRSGDDIDVRSYVKIKKIPGGSIQDCFLVNGVLFSKKASSKSMDRSLRRPRIALLTFSLDYACDEQRILSLDLIISQQEEYIINLVNRICMLKPNLVFAQGQIPSIALKYFEEHGVIAFHGLKESVLYDIARCCRADIISSIDKLSLCPRLGTCGRFQLRTYVVDENKGLRKTFAILDRCSERLGCTIVLRGADYNQLSKVKKIVELVVLIAYHIKLECALLRDKFVNMPELFETTYQSLSRKSLPSFSSTAADKEKSQNHEKKSLNSDNQSLRPLENENQSVSSTQGSNSPLELINNLPASDDYSSITKALKTRFLTFSPFLSKPLPRLLNQVNYYQFIRNKLLKDVKLHPYSPTGSFVMKQSENDNVEESYEESYKFFCIDERYHFLEKQWTLYYSHSKLMFSPFSSQRIILLYSIINKETSVPCIGPERCLLEFYRETDCTLGQYIEDSCLNTNVSCGGEYCKTNDMLWHYRSYVHGNSRISVFLESFSCPVPGLEEKIIMWSYCKFCKKNTHITVMSEETWKYSFGKYLEFMFYNSQIRDRFEFCDHSVMAQHVHYFGYCNMALRFQRDPIEIFELFVPSVTLRNNPSYIKELKEKEYKRLKGVIEKCLSSVASRINQIKCDWVTDPEKFESCTSEISKFRTLLSSDYTELYSEFDSIYLNSSTSDYLSLNSILRVLQGKMVKWEQRFLDYQRLYLPSYKELSKIAAAQIKKVFLERPLSQTPLDLPETLENTQIDIYPSFKTESTDDQLEKVTQTNVASNKRVAPYADSMANVGSPESDCFSVATSSDIPKANIDFTNDISTQNTFPASPVSNSGFSRQTYPNINQRQGVNMLSHKRKSASTSDRRFVNASSTSGMNMPISSSISAKISSIQNSTKYSPRKPIPAKDVRVSSLVRRFEELSLQLQEKQKRDEELIKARRKRALPVVPSKPVVEVFNDLNEAFDDENSEDENGVNDTKENRATESNFSGVDSMSKERENVSSNEDNSPEAFEDIFGILFKNESGLEEQQNLEPSSQMDKEGSKLPTSGPLADKTSVYRILSAFWNEWNSLNPPPFEFPLQPTEHMFSDSNVIIREDEPSSLISFTLSSPDYLSKMVEIEDSMDEALTNQGLQGSTQFKIENLMLKPTGTHLKYQFEEGSARLSCKVFFAEQFSALRRACGCEETFVTSLARCSLWESSGGKSGSAFLKTFDKKYILKVLSRLESDSLLNFAPAYFDYISKVFFHELPTALTKIFGFYRVDIRNPTTGTICKADIMIMENVFYDECPSRIFDLKGSMRNRHVESTGKVDEVLLDENLVELIYESPIFVSEQLKSLLHSCLWNDTLFLSKLNIMDYSLIVGIDYTKKELYVGIIDFIRTYTWDKKLESWVKEKGLVGRGPEPTIVTPKQYKNRFRKAMDCYILASQDFETGEGFKFCE